MMMTDRMSRASLSVEDLETTLQRSLRPVRPDPKFKDDLHQRLVTPPALTLEKQSRAVGLLLIAAGLLSGVLVLLVGRGLYRLVSKGESR